MEVQLSSCVSQYEERLARVNTYLEQSQASYQRAQDDLKKFISDTATSWDSLRRLIGRSIELKNRILTIDEKRQSGSNKHTGLNNDLVDLELDIGRLMEFKENTFLEGLRDHMIEIYSKLGLHLLKRQLSLGEQLQKQE